MIKIFTTLLLLFFTSFTAHAGVWETKYNSLPACGSKKDWITENFVDFTSIQYEAPLGNMNPPGHTLPTHHLYINPPLDASNIPQIMPVFIPRDLTVVAIEKNNHGTFTDYKVHFKSCKEIRFYFDHISVLSTELMNQFNQTPVGDILIQGSGEIHYVFYKSTNIISVGTAGGTVNTRGFDFGVVDTLLTATSANPDRYVLPANVIPPGTAPERIDAVVPRKNKQWCPFDYMTARMQFLYSSKLGGFNNGVFTPRTIAPVCGQVIQDVIGTAQGNWFQTGGSFIDETKSMALVFDNFNPTIPVFSFGDNSAGGIKGLSVSETSKVYQYSPTGTGTVNPYFYNMTNGTVYCFRDIRNNGVSLPGAVVVQLFNQGTGFSSAKLRIERQASTTCRAAVSISSDATVFSR